MATLRGERRPSFGSPYRLEQLTERLAFLKALQEANEEDEHCIKLFEELSSVWCEQIRESRRTSVRNFPWMEDLKLIALAARDDGVGPGRF